MGIERIVQYECRVCGRKIDVTRTGDVYEEPVYCCGLEATSASVLSAPPAPAVRKKPVAKKVAKKKAAKKAVKKAAKKRQKKRQKSRPKRRQPKKPYRKKPPRKR